MLSLLAGTQECTLSLLPMKGTLSRPRPVSPKYDRSVLISNLSVVILYCLFEPVLLYGRTLHTIVDRDSIHTSK